MRLRPFRSCVRGLASLGVGPAALLLVGLGTAGSALAAIGVSTFTFPFSEIEPFGTKASLFNFDGTRYGYRKTGAREVVDTVGQVRSDSTQSAYRVECWVTDPQALANGVDEFGVEIGLDDDGDDRADRGELRFHTSSTAVTASPFGPAIHFLADLHHLPANTVFVHWFYFVQGAGWRGSHGGDGLGGSAVFDSIHRSRQWWRHYSGESRYDVVISQGPNSAWGGGLLFGLPIHGSAQPIMTGIGVGDTDGDGLPDATLTQPVAYTSQTDLGTVPVAYVPGVPVLIEGVALLVGTAGDDFLLALAHRPHLILAGPGNDFVLGSRTGRDVLLLAGGNDVAICRGPNSFIAGGSGHDVAICPRGGRPDATVEIVR